jgi:two-component system alkaline phosphatase synthesis response regulator PhoP
MHLLIAEDEIDLAEALTVSFEKNQFSVDAVHDGFDAYEYAMAAEYDAIILDVMMPKLNGVEVLQKLRDAGVTTPVMMLTAKGTEYDTVLALDAGADDYVQKPFRMMELLSRIRALIRRSEGYGTPAGAVEYQAEHLEVSPARHLVRVDGKDVTLTLKEFELLCLLLENKGIVLSRDRILDKVWGDAMGRESRTVDVHIRTLRQKLGPAGGCIETVRGIGYKLKGAD